MLLSIMDLFRRLEAERIAKASFGPPEWLIVGLGNPGGKYSHTRHNAGFSALDAVAEKYNISVKTSKFNALCGSGTIAQKSVMLLKPQTFMNLSGKSVSEAAAFYKIPNDKILVVYDDISMACGKLRIREKGSAGGHNGIKNIISSVGSDVFPRIKVGVGAPPHPDYDIIDWVLGSFSADEQKILQAAILRIVDILPVLLTDGCARASEKINIQT